MKTKILLLTLLAALPFPLRAGDGAATVKAIDQYRAGLEKDLSAGKFSIRMFVKPLGGQASWKEILRDKELDQLCKNGCSDSFSVYRRGSAVLVATLESGDVAGTRVRYIESYFREDGTLALSRSDFRRSEGKGDQHRIVQVVRLRYYDPQGKLIKETAPVYTELLKKKPMASAKLDEGPWAVYLLTKNIPVWDLLK